MLEKLDEIEKTLERKCYLAAVTLALTIPDICGKIKYPNEKVGYRYKKWFEDYVEIYYVDHNGWDNINKRAKNPYFTSDMCYSLRCELLHAGTINIENFGKIDKQKYEMDFSFRLMVHGCDSYGHSTSGEKDGKINRKNIVTLEVVKFCKSIVSSAKKFYSERNIADFSNSKVDIVDLKERLADIEKSNQVFK